VEQQKVNAQKNAANKAKVQATASKSTIKRSKPKMRTVTGSEVNVKPGMKTVTSKDVTVTAKKPTTVDQSGAIYLVKNKPGEKGRQVSFQEYSKHVGPKDKMQRDASGYILEKGSGGKRISIDYIPAKGWKKW
jgi:hypothetical protein